MTNNEQNNATPISENDHQELLALYQNATAEIEGTKKREWQVFVFFSASVAFLINQANNWSNIIKTYISIVLLIGTIAAVLILILYKQKKDKERKVLKDIYKRFGQPFNECRKHKGDVQEDDLFEKLFIIGGSIYIFVIFIFTMAIFWCPKCSS